MSSIHATQNRGGGGIISEKQRLRYVSHRSAECCKLASSKELRRHPSLASRLLGLYYQKQMSSKRSKAHLVGETQAGRPNAGKHHHAGPMASRRYQGLVEGRLRGRRISWDLLFKLPLVVAESADPHIPK